MNLGLERLKPSPSGVGLGHILSGKISFEERSRFAKNLLGRDFRPACAALKLPLVSWHSFRHTHATLLSEVGESSKTAQALLGHSDMETTLNVYAHATPESQKCAVDKVAEILFPNFQTR